MSFFVVSVNPFNGGKKGAATPDVNGLFPVILTGRNGDLPERARVLSGTVAKNAGIEAGTIYLLSIDDLGEGEYGTIYRHQVIGSLTAVEFATSIAQMPQGRVFKVSTTQTEVANVEKTRF